jgi:predicted transcriptional regulator of viral defense system
MQRSEALEALLEAASEQGGYVTAAQGTRLGLQRDDIARLITSGDLQRLRHGVFRMRHGQAEHEDDVAAWLHFERGRLPWERHGATNAVVSHASAAALHRLGTIIPQRPTVTLVAADSPHVSDIAVRRAPLRPEDWTWLDVGPVRLPATTPARTIVDLVLDREEPSYVARAVHEARVRQLAGAEDIMDAARHRKARSGALRTRIARLVEETS